MRLSRFSGTVLLGLVLALPALAVAQPTRNEAGSSAREGAGRLMHAATVACHELADRGVFCEPMSQTRRELWPGVGYYTLQVKVGPGEHDFISLHRVVAEERPGRPASARKAVFMIHGDILGFEGAFLGLTVFADPSQISLPVFLARNGVDAWGISYRWTHIPVGFPDTSFMAGWGMDVAVSDARVGLRIARVARLLDGQGHGGLHVLGWSRGVWTTMALANAEATEPPHRRDIAGIIPVDGSFKGDPQNEAWRQYACADDPIYTDWMAAGTYGQDTSFLAIVGQWAIDSPNEPSPFNPGLTNAQFATGFVSWPMGFPGMEWYHFAAGTFDGDIPTGLVYQDPALSFVELSRVFGYDPVPYLMDASALVCDERDVPWDDHLSDVRVPMFYVGAAGGFGTVGQYLTQLVGSPDVTSQIVRTRPPEEVALDVGHADIFWAPESRKLFWRPILAWIRAH